MTGVAAGGTARVVDLRTDAGLVVAGGSPAVVLGNSVADAGDVNCDGFDDVVLGAATECCTPELVTDHVVYGGPLRQSLKLANLTATSGSRIRGVLTRGDLRAVGSVVSGAGDVNGDGYDDVVVGAYAAGNDDGAAYVLFGGPRVATSTCDRSHPPAGSPSGAFRVPSRATRSLAAAT